MTEPLLQTAFHAWHTENGGRLVDFAGWDIALFAIGSDATKIQERGVYVGFGNTKEDADGRVLGRHEGVLRYTVGQFTIVTSQPAFVDLAFFHAAIGVNQVPEGHHAGTGLTFVLFCFSIETQSFAADRRHRVLGHLDARFDGQGDDDSVVYRIQNLLRDGSDFNAANLHVAAGLQSADLGEYRFHAVPLDGSHLGGGDENIEECKGDQ